MEDTVLEGSKIEVLVQMAITMSKTPLEGFCLITMAAKMFAERYKRDQADMEKLTLVMKEIMENYEAVFVSRSSESNEKH